VPAKIVESARSRKRCRFWQRRTKFLEKSDLVFSVMLNPAQARKEFIRNVESEESKIDVNARDIEGFQELCGVMHGTGNPLRVVDEHGLVDDATNPRQDNQVGV
jgi:hypothetical protein